MKIREYKSERVCILFTPKEKAKHVKLSKEIGLPLHKLAKIAFDKEVKSYSLTTAQISMNLNDSKPRFKKKKSLLVVICEHILKRK